MICLTMTIIDRWIVCIFYNEIKDTNTWRWAFAF